MAVRNLSSYNEEEYGELANVVGTWPKVLSSSLRLELVRRRKKIKCDGCEPTCSQCASSGSQCTWLQTKDRGTWFFFLGLASLTYI